MTTFLRNKVRKYNTKIEHGCKWKKKRGKGKPGKGGGICGRKLLHKRGKELPKQKAPTVGAVY